MKDNFKNKVFATTILLAVISSSSNALALKDATQINNTTGFVPNSDTRAARAEQSAATALSKANGVESTANSAYSTAIEANGIAKGTRSTLTNKNGCVYNAKFNCTEDNLTHSYQDFQWRSIGSYTWTVPSNITEVYVSLVGGQGGTGAAATENYDAGYDIGGNGGKGGDVLFSALKALGGAGGAGGTTGAGSYGSIGGTLSQKISVSPGSRISININNGLLGVRGRGGAGGQNKTGDRGKSGSVTIKY